MRGCDECNTILGMLSQGDWRVDDSTGCAYCDDCWLNWELARRLRGILGLAGPRPAAFSCFRAMQPCGRDALNSWFVPLPPDLVPFLRGAELYSAMCTGRACFEFYRVAVTKLRIKLYCFAAWQTHAEFNYWLGPASSISDQEA